MGYITSAVAMLGAGAMLLTGAAGDSTQELSAQNSTYVYQTTNGYVPEYEVSNSPTLPVTHGGYGMLVADSSLLSFFEFHIVTITDRGDHVNHVQAGGMEAANYSTLPTEDSKGGCFWVNNSTRPDLELNMHCEIEYSSSYALSSPLASTPTDTNTQVNRTEEVHSSSTDSHSAAASSASGDDFEWTTRKDGDGNVCLSGVSKIDPNYSFSGCAPSGEVKKNGMSVRFKADNGGDERAYFMPSEDITSVDSGEAGGTESLGEIVTLDGDSPGVQSKSSGSDKIVLTSKDGREFEFSDHDMSDFNYEDWK